MAEDAIIKECEESLDKLNEVIEVAAALTTKQRKSLKASVFCGSGRSFPTPDCVHIRVAKAYLGRSKFSKSSKQKIAACINRRAKLLKCSVTKKAKAAEELLDFTGHTYAKLSKEEQKLYDSKVFKSTKELVEKSIANPGTI